MAKVLVNNKSYLKEIKEKYSFCLYHNDSWRRSIRDYLEYVEEKNTEATIQISIFNPENILETIAFYNATGEDKYLPKFSLVVDNQHDNEIEIFEDCLFADNVRDCGLSEIVEEFFDGDPSKIFFKSHCHEIYEINSKILQRLGLMYGCNYKKIVNYDIAEELREPSVRSESIYEGNRPFNIEFDNWLDKNPEFTESVKNVFQKCLIGSQLANDHLGYTLNIKIGNECNVYGPPVAEAILNVFEKKKFNGRCEYFAVDGIIFGMVDRYLVGIELKTTENKVPPFSWWRDFTKKVDQELNRIEPALEIDHTHSKPCDIKLFRLRYLPRGIVQFVQGMPVAVLDADEFEVDSHFIAYVHDKQRLKIQQ